MSIDDPEDTSSSYEEIEALMKIGEQTFEDLRHYRILRAFAGSRPLYKQPGASGRGASRGFVILDHEKDGLKGMMTIVGGKFTTYRLMAERMADDVCRKLGNTKPCRTAEEPLVEEVSQEERQRAKRFFPSFGTDLAATRMGPERFHRVVEVLEKNPEKRELVCECENVTRAEAEEIAREPTSYIVNDVRRRTRIGMGTCQGNFCALRAASVFAEAGHQEMAKHSLGQMQKFLEGRWKGVRPVLMGRTIRETEMTRGIYELVMNINGGNKA